MRHSYFGKKLSRTKNERRRLLQGLARELVMRGGIETTLAKAKAVQPLVEKLVTKAKRANSSDLMEIRKVLVHKVSTDRLLEDAKTRFAGRNSGYTRILKTGNRMSDSSRMAYISFVDEIVKTDVLPPKKTSAPPKKTGTPAKKTEKPKTSRTRRSSSRKTTVKKDK